MKRRTFCSAVGLGGLGLMAHRQAAAAQFPGTVNLVVTTSASTSADMVARLISQYLAPKLNRTLVVENRTGASGIIGMQSVARGPNDGSAVMIAPNTLLTITPLNKNLPFDPRRDFIPVMPLAVSTMAAIASMQSGFRTLDDFVQAAKKNPGKLNYGSPGVGTPQHLLMEAFREHYGIQVTHIPFKATAPMVTDLAGGRIDIVFMPVHTSVELAKAGKVRVVAVNSDTRSALYPDVPTVAEQGYEMEKFDWSCGMFLPLGTPAELVKELETVTMPVMKMPEVGQSLAAAGLAPLWSTSDEFRKKYVADIDKWTAIAHRAGVKPE